MRRTPRIALVLVLAAAAACIAQPDSNNGIASAGGVTTTSPGPAAGGGNYDPINWVKCLREHGIVVDDPDSSEPGGGKPRFHEELNTKEQIDAAAEACRQYNANWGKPNPPPDPADIERQRQFAQCMREHGIDWDDPDPNFQTGAPPPPGAEPEAGKPTPSGPEFERAIRECGDKIPGVVTPEDGTKK